MTQKMMGTALLVLTCLWALAGCHTVKGVGEDVQSGGRVIERSTGE
ncbi:entericidin A/B family lipoprotein [Geotalea sp. SG265]|nr:entericidin A/B family lipoprotein [Geotalea sp. SG265]